MLNGTRTYVALFVGAGLFLPLGCAGSPEYHRAAQGLEMSELALKGDIVKSKNAVFEVELLIKFALGDGGEIFPDQEEVVFHAHGTEDPSGAVGPSCWIATIPAGSFTAGKGGAFVAVDPAGLTVEQAQQGKFQFDLTPGVQSFEASLRPPTGDRPGRLKIAMSTFDPRGIIAPTYIPLVQGERQFITIGDDEGATRVNKVSYGAVRWRAADRLM